MHRIDGDGHSSNRFVEGNPGLGVPATQVTSVWLNAVQEEIAKLLEARGVPLDKANNGQLAALLTDGAWVTPALGSGWSNFLGRPPQYRIDAYGRVWWRGVASRTAGAGAVPGPLIADGVLPANARPAQGTFYIPICAFQDSSTKVLAWLQVDAQASNGIGDLEIQLTGNVLEVYLDGVSYYVT